MILNQALFIAGLLLALSGRLSPPVALTLGAAYGLTFLNPHQALARTASRWLLQTSVVGLGFGMNLGELLRTGRSGLVYTAMTIAITTALGLGLGRFLKVAPTPSLLITIGTAICGGSAIAAVGPVIQASDDEMAVSLGTVFVLNSVALLTFPAIGSMLHLSQPQFGLWAALAIHDTSSVVGATAKYGAVALAIGTTVKLARALWIVPVSAAIAMWKRSGMPVQWPWFIVLFCLAAFANTSLPAFHSFYAAANRVGKIGLIVTLYLIGTGFSREMLRKVGLRPLLQGLVLWMATAIFTLTLIWIGFIGL